MCRCMIDDNCRCKMRDISREKINKLVAMLSKELSDKELETIKTEIVRELDIFEFYAKEGCSCE